jgi:hypothetical protein
MDYSFFAVGSVFFFIFAPSPILPIISFNRFAAPIMLSAFSARPRESIHPIPLVNRRRRLPGEAVSGSIASNYRTRFGKRDRREKGCDEPGA